MHPARFISLGHLLVDNPAAGRHPLDIPGGDGAFVSQAVPVLDASGQHIGDGLDAAVGVPREAGQIVPRNVVPEIIEKKEGVEVGSLAETKRAAQVHARAFHGWLGPDEPLDRSK